MKQKELCLAWLEWFKGWVETHDRCHSSGVLATTSKTFDYHIWECNDEIRFISGIRFKIRESEREVYVPYVNRTYVVTDKGDEYFYQDVLESLTRTLVYGKEDFNLPTIFAGKSDLNWKQRYMNDENYIKKTLRDIINDVHPNTFR